VPSAQQIGKCRKIEILKNAKNSPENCSMLEKLYEKTKEK
jgi:hypothetical protein